MTAAAILALVFVPMVIEAAISARNEGRLRALGAREPHDDVFGAMQFGYPAAFLAMVAEAWWRQPQFDRVFGAGLALFIASKILKYWAITTLGSRWTFRVLVPPGSTRVVAGPYRYSRHPNYVAVTGELVSVALMAHAILAGPVVTVGFIFLMRRRIAVEESALGLRGMESRR